MLALKRIPALFSLAALLCLLPLNKSSAAQFLWLSDIHFDPFVDPSLGDQLANAEPAQWAGILAGGAAKFPAFGRDTSWPLFSSALDASRQAQPKATFTIVTGDLLAHHFREQFNAAASIHDDQAFRNFVHKSLEFMALQFKQVSQGAPVILSLGNNDDLCGDYLIQPNGPFLHDTGKLVSDLAGVADVNSFSATWSATGSYSLPHPTLRNHRVIVLNTVFFSPRYRDGCGHSSGDPGEAVLTWLANQLAAARSRREKVWLVYHIPPGIDVFATTHPKQPASEGTITLLWKDSYARKFAGLMNQYPGLVGPIFAGHIHVDDFRLLSDSSKQSAFIMIAPAVSPNIGQNPGFRILTYDSRGRLTDQSTYFLSNLTAAAKGAAPVWQLEYSFRNEWRMPELNAANYSKLYREIGRSSELASRWKLLYPVSRTAQGSITPANSRQFYCAIGNLFTAEYQACMAMK